MELVLLALVCIATISVGQTTSTTPSSADTNGFTPDTSAEANAPPGCTPPRCDSYNTFDFIIVGTGAGGSVVANKLSAITGWKILVLEAGKPSQRDLGGTDFAITSFVTDPVTGALSIGTPYTRFDVPAFYKSLFQNPPGAPLAPLADWTITGGPLCGKLIGGSHCHNGMLWMHPTQSDIARWNIPSWPYSDFIAKLTSAENVTGSMLQGQPGHGLSGPIQISDATVIDYAENLLVNLSISYGIPYNPNLDSSPRRGSGYANFNIRRGVRDSAAMAFLRPALSRPNLQFIHPAQVTRVLFSTCNGSKNATGVQFVRTILGRNYTFTAYARKEVILSAGTILSPWILMNSGIGPAAQLTTYGKPIVVANENVGQHISNNLNFNMQFQARNYSPPNFWDFTNQYDQYAQNGTGILATHSNEVAAVFIKTLNNLTDADIALATNLDAGSLFAKALLISVEVCNPVYENGTVMLQSSDPTVTPIYAANANVNPADIQTIIRGVRAVREIMAQPAAVNYFGAELAPGPLVQSDADLTAYITPRVTTFAHYVSSNRMGIATDPTRVVDDHCRVVGVNNLRVIDASIIPKNVNSFVSATAVGVGVKGASIVLADYGY